MPRKVIKKNESGAREALRPAAESGSSPPTSTRSRDLGSLAPSSSNGNVPAAWLDQLFAAVLALPLDEGPQAVVTALVDALAAILPAHAVGACYVPEPGASSQSQNQLVVTRLPAGAVASPPGIDPTRVFPGLKHEIVVAVRGSKTGSTLHLGSDGDAVDAEGACAAGLLDRASAALGSALHVSRQITSPGPDPRRSHDFEERMIQADKLATFGQIAAGIVHELNNPLTSIVAYSDYLIRRAVSAQGSPESSASRDPDDVDRLRRISESANRMLRFTRDFVAYARPSSGVAGPVILHGVVDQAVAFCEHVLSQAGVSVERRYASEVRTVRGISEQLVQVFVNLLTNASQAAPSVDGRITITTSLDPVARRVLVVVEDNGGGIAPEHLRQVFLPFFTTKGDRHGTGLGLSIVKTIVDGHDGKIHVESPRDAARGSSSTSPPGPAPEARRAHGQIMRALKGVYTAFHGQLPLPGRPHARREAKTSRASPEATRRRARARRHGAAQRDNPGGWRLRRLEGQGERLGQAAAGHLPGGQQAGFPQVYVARALAHREAGLPPPLRQRLARRVRGRVRQRGRRRTRLAAGVRDGRATTPSTIVLSVGSHLSFKNSDPFPHSLYEVGNASWGANPTAPGSSRDWAAAAAGVHVIRDTLFPSLVMYIVVDAAAVEATYPDRDGNFTMTLPNGDYTLKAFFDGKPVGKPIDGVHVGDKDVEIKDPMSLGDAK